MAYTLVSMPALGFDLCRLPRGPVVAEVLLVTLDLDADGLAELALAHPGPMHAARLDLARAGRAPRPTLVAGLRELGDGAGPAGDTSALVTSLERGLIGSVDALLRLLRDDILDWTRPGDGSAGDAAETVDRAVEVVAGALVAAYSSEVLPATTQAELAAPWRGADLPTTAPNLGPYGVEVRTALGQLTTLTAPHLQALRAAAEHRGGAPVWATAVHDASWAVYLAGRLRPAAAAQLLAVQAFRAAGFTPRDGAYGLWNLVSGVVQSLVVTDLLDHESTTTLQQDWRRIVGSP